MRILRIMFHPKVYLLNIIIMQTGKLINISKNQEYDKTRSLKVFMANFFFIDDEQKIGLI